VSYSTGLNHSEILVPLWCYYRKLPTCVRRDLSGSLLLHCPTSSHLSLLKIAIYYTCPVNFVTRFVSPLRVFYEIVSNPCILLQWLLIPTVSVNKPDHQKLGLGMPRALYFRRTCLVVPWALYFIYLFILFWYANLY